jgi:hypothetical protein
MKTSAMIASIVVLLLFGSFPAEGNILKDLAAISIIRERSTEFGFDINGYSNEEILDFLHAIPSEEMEEFQESYARRPNYGTTMTAELEAINRVEFDREKKLLDKWVDAWEKSRSENRSASESRQKTLYSFAVDN